MAFKEVRGDGLMPVPKVRPTDKSLRKTPLGSRLQRRWTTCLWPQKYQTWTPRPVWSPRLAALCTCAVASQKYHEGPWPNFPLSHVSSLCHLCHHRVIFIVHSVFITSFIFMLTAYLGELKSEKKEEGWSLLKSSYSPWVFEYEMFNKMWLFIFFFCFLYISTHITHDKILHFDFGYEAVCYHKYAVLSRFVCI